MTKTEIEEMMDFVEECSEIINCKKKYKKQIKKVMKKIRKEGIEIILTGEEDE